MRPVSKNKILALYASSHYLLHCPADILIALSILITQHFDLDIVQYGLIVTIAGFTSGICSPLGGVLADRFSRKIFPPLSMLIMGGITLIMGLFGGVSIYLFVSCLLIMAFASAIFHPAGMTTISDRFQKGRSKAFSVFGIGGQAGYGTGPLTVAAFLWIGGGIIKNWQVTYLLWSFPILIMSIIMIIIHSKDPTIGDNSIEPPIKIQKINNATNKSISTAKILLIPTFLLLMLVISVQSFARRLYEPYLVFFLTDIRQFNKTTAVLLYSMLSLIGLPGTLLGGIAGDKYGEKSILIIASALATIGLTLLVFVQKPVFLLLVFFLLALGQNATMPITDSWTAKLVPLKVRGKAYGISFLFPVMFGSIAPTVAALIILTGNYNILFFIAIGLLMLTTLMPFLIRETPELVVESAVL